MMQLSKETTQNNSPPQQTFTPPLSPKNSSSTEGTSSLHRPVSPLTPCNTPPSSPIQRLKIASTAIPSIPDLDAPSPSPPISLPNFTPLTARLLHFLLRYAPPHVSPTALAGFLSLLLTTTANYILAPIRDATALRIGLEKIPSLTLASAILALVSSVPVGWLFEAPNPMRNRIFGQWGLTRGETQGSSLALGLRVFAFLAMSYSVWLYSGQEGATSSEKYGHVVFFLLVHLMRLHSISLVWGVVGEAMEYEERGEERDRKKRGGEFGKWVVHDLNVSGKGSPEPVKNKGKSRIRLKRLAFASFGGTIGGMAGSIITSLCTHTLGLPGLLILSAILLELSANLSLELGNVMYRHWYEEQQQLPAPSLNDWVTNSDNNNESANKDTASSDICLRRSTSTSSMKRIASGNSLVSRSQSRENLLSSSTLGTLSTEHCSQITNEDTPSQLVPPTTPSNTPTPINNPPPMEEDNTFKQRLLRGITTILRSKLLMSIFTYNGLYASTNVLLSFQRAALISKRSVAAATAGHVISNINTESTTAFLANINVWSGLAVFVLQITGVGAGIAHNCGMQGTLSLMPIIRLVGVLILILIPSFSSSSAIYTPSSLYLFLLIDELCKVINFAVAKPVRESLWRGLSNEARYEAKPIVDTLANRWGGGSAAFLVQTISWIIGSQEEQKKNRMSLVLCSIISVWWILASVSLGVIRRRIDVELKKRQ